MPRIKPLVIIIVIEKKRGISIVNVSRFQRKETNKKKEKVSARQSETLAHYVAVHSFVLFALFKFFFDSIIFDLHKNRS